MRTCARCDAEMIEGLELCSTEGDRLAIREKGWFKKSLGRIWGAACPSCGYVESYLEDTAKLKELKYKR